MKPPKRYSLREEIEREIDDAEWRLRISIKLAVQYDDKHKAHRSWLTDHPPESIKTDAERDEWHIQRNEMNRCIEKQKLKLRSHRRAQRDLDKLKLKLAEFDTEPMLFMEDRSIKA